MNVYLSGEPEQFPNYVRALTALGAAVRHTGPERCEALLLPGGGDVDPRRYGRENAGSREIDPERDAREFAALRLFIDAGKPVLGICRGAQVINVFFGGTLIQHLEGHSQIDGVDRLHGSRAADPALLALYGERFTINSSHHQTVERLGTGLVAVQWADDGVIEGIRHRELPVFAVQWHPERLRRPTDGWLLLGQWLETVSGAATRLS